MDMMGVLNIGRGETVVNVAFHQKGSPPML